MYQLSLGRMLNRKFAVATLCVGMLLSATAPADARTAPGNKDPNTVVSSDGFIPSVNTESAEARAGASAPSKGSGGQLEGSALEIADLESYKSMPGDTNETIFPPDTRVRVNPTTGYPARATALILFKQGGSNFRCTGWFISRRTIATAGHCVHAGKGGSFSTDVRVYPGANGNLAPFGFCRASRLFTVSGWTSSSDTNFDYGAIQLNCTVGSRTGWYGFRNASNLLRQTTLIQGYPGDKPLTQWRSQDVVRSQSARKIFYRNDTIGGMSGSPVYNFSSLCGGVSGPCAFAIHTTGGSSLNGGTRLVTPVFNNLIAWR
jgi:glutamyl endopeptidase